MSSINGERIYVTQLFATEIDLELLSTALKFAELKYVPEKIFITDNL